MPGNSELVNALSGGGLLSAIAHPTVVNPLAAYSQAAEVANRVWANREMQAHQAQGQAAIGAINRDTGQMDQAAYGRGMIAAGPGAAIGAQDSMAKGQQLSTNQLGFNDAQQTRLARLIGGMVNQPDQTPQAYSTQIEQQGAAAGLDANHIAAAKANIAALGPNPTPEAMRLFGTRMMVGALAGPDIARIALPQTALVSTPQGAIPVVSQPAPITGAPPTGAVYQAPGGVAAGLSPGESAQRVPTIDNNLYMPDGKTPNPNYGQKVTVPLGTVTPSTGAQPGGGPTALGAPSPTNQPRLAPPAAGGGALPSEIPPGADIPIKAANDAWAAANANANTYAQRSFPVTQALALAKSGDLTTGQGAQAVNDIKSFLQTRASSFGWNVQTIANSKFQELDKYLQQNVNAQPMAAGSDARLASALTGNPTSHLNNLALTDVLKATQALQRMEQMAALDFRARGEPNGQWNRFMSDWQTSHDPRAFVFDQMSDEQRAKMVGGMKDGERAAFGRTLALIKEHPEILNTAAMPH